MTPAKTENSQRQPDQRELAERELPEYELPEPELPEHELSGNARDKNAPACEALATAMASRSPLAQLLHALNQPLTGLQCSMEVALARERTAEQYVHGLREGLELTGRMRALVGAIREVADGLDEDQDEDQDEDRDKDKDEDENRHTQAAGQTAELSAILHETVNDLKPVAESKSVRVILDCSSALSVGRRRRRRLNGVIFRLLDSALSLAAERSEMRIDTGSAADASWLRIRWEGAEASVPGGAFSPPELGLLVAQAGCERSGAGWERTQMGKVETVTIRLPGTSRGGGTS